MINKSIWSFNFVIYILLVSSILYFTSFSLVSAQSKIILSQRITKSELQPGYTITTPEQNIKIIIKPNTFNRSVFVELIKPDFYPNTPLDKDIASNIHHYAILPATNNKLKNAISIKIKYLTSKDKYKEIYIYNQELSKWKHLPCIIDKETKTITAQTYLASGFVAVFSDHLNKSEYLKKEINSESILVVDTKTGEILVERLSNKQRPIASLTKLMTAAVFLDHNPGWNKKISITKSDDSVPSKIYVNPGEKLTAHDLFYAMLIKSANNAAKALARSTGLTHSEFVKKMNEKAIKFGMKGTYFEEETGLSKNNVSTAQDLMILSKKLFSKMTFLQATTPKYLTISTSKGKKIKIKNSNKLLNMPYTILGTKTGFTYEAGRCLDMKVKNKKNQEVIAITLGANKISAHWNDMRILLNATLK